MLVVWILLKSDIPKLCPKKCQKNFANPEPIFSINHTASPRRRAAHQGLMEKHINSKDFKPTD